MYVMSSQGISHGTTLPNTINTFLHTSVAASTTGNRTAAAQKQTIVLPSLVATGLHRHTQSHYHPNDQYNNTHQQHSQELFGNKAFAPSAATVNITTCNNNNISPAKDRYNSTTIQLPPPRRPTTYGFVMPKESNPAALPSSSHLSSGSLNTIIPTRNVVLSPGTATAAVVLKQLVSTTAVNRTRSNTTAPHGSEESRPSFRLCKVEGCKKLKQTRGLCKSHGGGSRCSVPGCTKTNQGGGLCRSHGGGKRCIVPGCDKGAQRKSLCHSHGGIRYCTVEGCKSKDRGSGFCAKHGGGKKCKAEGCTRPSRKKGLCATHLTIEKKRNANNNTTQ